MKKIANKITPFQRIILGFLGVILVGSLLLMLPFATSAGKGASFFDALFTSTSAACVTGLIVHDTATYWSLFGQIVILILIQIGGLGVITIAAAVTMISRRRIGLMQRSTMQEAIAAPQVGGIVKLTNFSIKSTLIAEAVGSALMSPVFCSRFGLGKGIWYSVFHSITAFCNAGFDLMGVESQYSSLTGFAGSWLINIVICMLVVFGGLGFLTWDDIVTHKFKLKKYRMQSKVILTASFWLNLIPALYFFFFEFNNSKWGMNGSERLLASVFQAISPRTAGFNTVDLSQLSGGGLVLDIFLMLVGGSPGSTAGGMKTTTIAVLFAATISVYTRKKYTNFFRRSISESAVITASAILMGYTTLFVTSGVIISKYNNIPILSALFETASAIGTVGLSLGVTPHLFGISRAIIILLMFLGRVGSLTLIFAAVSLPNANVSKLPQEKIAVG